MRVFSGLDELVTATGEQLGHSDWHTITQQEVNLFAEATGDNQWIHVDTARAAAGPFGGTIAHGYLTLSLVPRLARQIYRVDGVRMSINYGANKVRFPAPVPVGARVRVGAELVRVTPGPQGWQVVVRYTVEIEDRDKPACVAESVVLLIP